MLIIFIVFAVLIFLLQRHLSRAKSRWPGLILPLLSLLLTMAICLTSMTGFSTPARAIGGANGPTSIYVTSQQIPLRTTIVHIIPTAALLIVYFIQRKRGRHNRDMDKSRIQDL